MKILLIGEYSNVHWTLAEGLRLLGHDITVASDGDGWKNYRRDINLNYLSLKEKLIFHLHHKFPTYVPSLQYLKISQILNHDVHYDIIQLINPIFIHDTPRNISRLFKTLKSRCNKIYLGVYGNDGYYVKACLDRKLRYSILEPYFQDKGLKSYFQSFFDLLKPEWFNLNKMIASECDAIIAGAAEYYISYYDDFKEKLRLVPFPVNLSDIEFVGIDHSTPIKFILGKQRGREILKGAKFITEAMDEIVKVYKNEVELTVTENLSYNDWLTVLKKSDVLLDQVFGFSQGMSALQAMAMGKICFAGCEPEYLSIMKIDNAPVFNLVPDAEQNYNTISQFIDGYKQNAKVLSESSRKHVENFHDFVKNAKLQFDLSL